MLGENQGILRISENMNRFETGYILAMNIYAMYFSQVSSIRKCQKSIGY